MGPTTTPTHKISTPSPLLRYTVHPPAAPQKGKIASEPLLFSPVYPTAADLYREIPQRITHTYKSEANFASVLFVLLRRGWFSERAWHGATTAAGILSSLHPDYDALITNVP